MNIENVFQQVKQALSAELENVTLSDYDRYAEWAQPHHRIIENLLEIQQLNEKNNTVIPEPCVPEAEKEEVVEEKEEDSNYPVGSDFTFLKKANGGIIKELIYPVSEETVRTLELENENVIRITGIKGYFADKNPMYEIEVIDRQTQPNPDLAEIKQGIVESHGSRLVVTRTSTGSVYVKDLPACLYISDKDKYRLRIQEGDIVDGRFYTNNVTGSFRATYKYETETSSAEKPVESKKLAHRQTNSSTTECGPSMIDQLDKTPFLNTKILLVGLSSRMNDFSMMLRKTEDIQMIHQSGDEHKAKIRAQILKADIVIISTVENSHDASTYVAKICNEFNIPCRSTDEAGLSGVLRDAKDLIEKLAA